MWQWISEIRLTQIPTKFLKNLLKTSVVTQIAVQSWQYAFSHEHTNTTIQRIPSKQQNAHGIWLVSLRTVAASSTEWALTKKPARFGENYFDYKLNRPSWLDVWQGWISVAKLETSTEYQSDQECQRPHETYPYPLNPSNQSPWDWQWDSSCESEIRGPTNQLGALSYASTAGLSVFLDRTEQLYDENHTTLRFRSANQTRTNQTEQNSSGSMAPPAQRTATCTGTGDHLTSISVQRGRSRR